MDLLKHRPWLVAVVMLLATLSIASKEYTAPKALPAKTYPARDEHTDEKVTIAADPYDMPDKAATVFTLPYKEKDYLPIYLVITNDGDQPISLTDMRIQLITAQRDKIMPASSDDIYRRLSNPRANDRPTFPMPLPRRKVKGTVSAKTMEEIQSAQFAAKAVEPHNTRSGFLFFDVQGIRSLAGSHVLFTSLHNAQGGDLMFFEIHLDKYFGTAAVESP